MKINIPIEEQKINVIKWLDGLLTGSYRQGFEALGSLKYGFCCWGLGCHLMGIPFLPDLDWDDTLYEYIGFNSQKGDINPPIICKDSHIQNNNLAELNDNFKMSFPEIASYLIKYSNYNFLPEISIHIDQYYENNQLVKDILKIIFSQKYLVLEEGVICE